MERNLCPVRFIFWILISLVSVGCTSEPPIRLGLMTGVTGNMRDAGISARYALQLALKQCNDHGGILGRRVELIVKGPLPVEAGAAKEMRALIAEQVDAIVGPMSSTAALDILPVLDESSVVVISPTATTPRLAGRNDHFFRVCATTDVPARVSAEYQIRSGDIRRIAIVYDNDNPAFSEAFLRYFTPPFQAGGGQILSIEQVSSDHGESYFQVAQSLLKDHPDGILIIANTMESALFCQQIRKLSRSVKITLSNWSGTPRFLELGGEAVEGVTIPIAVNWESQDPRFQKFKKMFIDHFQRPPEFVSLNTYNAALVLLAALEARVPGQDLKDTILSLGDMNGLQGKIQFDPYGDLQHVSMSMYTVYNRRFHPLE